MRDLLAQASFWGLTWRAYHRACSLHEKSDIQIPPEFLWQISRFNGGGVRLAGASWRDARKVARGRGTPRTPGSGKVLEDSHLGRGAGNRRAVRPNVGVAPMEWVWARRFPAPLPGREGLVCYLPGVARNTAHPWLPSPHPSGMTRETLRVRSRASAARHRFSSRGQAQRGPDRRTADAASLRSLSDANKAVSRFACHRTPDSAAPAKDSPPPAACVSGHRKFLDGEAAAAPSGKPP